MTTEAERALMAMEYPEVLRRDVTIGKAHDCSWGCVFDSDRCSPGSGGFHGISSADVYFAVDGRHGAVVFQALSGWFWPETRTRLRDLKDPFVGASLGTGGPVTWHYATAQENTEREEACRYLRGAPCWGDIGYLIGMDAYEALTRQGTGPGGIWDWLEQQYERMK